MKPVVIVHNPIAGSGRAARLATRAAAELNRLGIAALQEPTAAQGDGTSIASVWEGRCRALLAVGGDGSLLAREFGFEPDPAKAARILAAVRIRGLDRLRVESSQAPPRTALLCAGVGFDAGVLAANTSLYGVPVQIDGDPADATPVTIGIEPGRVSLLVPG